MFRSVDDRGNTRRIGNALRAGWNRRGLRLIGVTAFHGRCAAGQGRGDQAGRETVAEVENGNGHVYFPLAIVPQVLWGDVNCSGDVEGGDALDVLRNVGGLDDNGLNGCPDIGTIINPDAICDDPLCSTTPRGGEPHVLVNGADGSIEQLSYTQ